MNPAFWKGKKVLVTGHTGFKGAGWRCGCNVWAPGYVGYSLPPPTQPSLFELARVAKA